MLVERTHYYAKPGRAEEVLRTRRRASEVRVRLGLAPGRIFAKGDPAADGPDVAWECDFPTAEAHAADLAARAASLEFGAVRAEMTALIARFERQILRHDAGPAAPGPWAFDALDGRPIVPGRLAFRSGEHELAGYLYTPPGPGPFPCLVTNHGSTIQQGTADICRPAMAAVLLAWGYASFLPHRRGYGDSPGPAWRSEVTAEFGTPEYDRALAARLDRESDDVVAALVFLEARPEIDAGRLGVMGSSFGGVVSLLAAAKAGTRVRCAVDFAGAAMNWERTPVLRETMLDAARRLRVPVFLVQAENDYSTAPTRKLAAELRRLGKPHQARIFPPFGLTPDEGHLFAGTGAVIWAPAVHAFLGSTLGG
jgi:dienelactone hydrolase